MQIALPKSTIEKVQRFQERLPEMKAGIQDAVRSLESDANMSGIEFTGVYPKVWAEGLGLRVIDVIAVQPKVSNEQMCLY